MTMPEAMQRQGFRLIAFDLDGTLVDEELEFAEEDLAAIEEVRKGGIQVTLATGRTFYSALPYIQKLKIDTPAILCNGAAIIEPGTQKILYQKQITKRIAQYAVQTAEEFKLDSVIFWDHLSDCPCTGMLTPLLSDFISLEGIRTVEIDNLADRLRSEAPVKIQIVGDEQYLISMRQSILNRFPDFPLVMTQKDYLEVMPKGTSKGEALRVLCSMLKVPLEQAMAFGDGMNDAELLSSAGFGVAMASAPEALKTLADTSTPSVAATLEDLFKG